MSPLPSPDKKRGKSLNSRFSATAATETDAPLSSRIANRRHMTNVFSGKKRGEQVVVTARGEYGGYDFADVVRLCKAVESGEIKPAWLEEGHKKHDPVDMNVPYSTIRRWLMDDDKYMQQYQTPAKRGVKGTAHWKVESEQRRRTELKSAGGYMGTGAPMLGIHTEQKLFLKMKEEAQSGTPYMTDEVAGLLLETAKKLKKVAPSTGLLYTDDTGVTGLHTAFLQRARAAGVPFRDTEGEPLSRARANGQNPEAVESFEELLDGKLLQIQQKEGPIGIDCVGNFDEFSIDLNDFCNQKFTFLDDGQSPHVQVPYEQAPHLSGLMGFLGDDLLDVLVVSIGADGNVPNPKHLELTQGKTPRVAISQSGNGWMTDEIKLGAIRQWVTGKSKLGTVRTVMNADGHGSNTRQLAVCKIMRDAKSVLAITPAHCTAKGMQQMDLKKGLISRFKKAFRRLMATE